VSAYGRSEKDGRQATKARRTKDFPAKLCLEHIAVAVQAARRYNAGAASHRHHSLIASLSLTLLAGNPSRGQNSPLTAKSSLHTINHLT